MPTLRWTFFGVALTASILVGMGVLFQYSNRPGQAAQAPAGWPKDTALVRVGGQSTLVLFAHPHCPCTRASISELAKVMSSAGPKLTAHVLFYRPAGFEKGWEKTDLWTSASAIPGVAVHSDEDGREAKRFGAFVSGQTMLYDSAGRLVFHGGITSARGHQGDNTGSEAIIGFVRKGVVPQGSTKVFGCSLVSTATTAQR